MDTEVDVLKARIEEALVNPEYGSLASSQLFDNNYKTTNQTVQGVVDKYLEVLATNKVIEQPTVQARSAVGCVIRQLRTGPIVGYILEDDEVSPCRIKFYGRRRARVFAKNSWKGLMITDITFKPMLPLEYIACNFTVTPNEAVVIGEQNG